MLEMTLLLADDEEELLENIIYDLKKSVKRIITAKNGAEALIKLKKEKIDCVVTDINMPQKNGITFAKEAREWGYNLPIIFLTAHGDDALMKKALTLNSFDFIDKPYTKADLLGVLEEAHVESLKLQEKIAESSEIDSEFAQAYLNMILPK